jgi:hypothetical protein
MTNWTDRPTASKPQPLTKRTYNYDHSDITKIAMILASTAHRLKAQCYLLQINDLGEYTHELSQIAEHLDTYTDRMTAALITYRKK